MYYFISENVFGRNSGTEHAAARRTRMFNAEGEQAFYVSRNYNPLLKRDLESVKLTAKESLNMYDFFQGTLAVRRKKQNLRLLNEVPLDEYHVEAITPNYSMITHVGREIGRINVLPGTVGLTMDVESRDQHNNLVARENWDWRGFKSSIDYFHPDGQVASRSYLSQDGDPVLEQLWMDVDGKRQPTMWKLLNYQGHDYRFSTEDQLFLFFLNELTKQDSNATLIADRHTLDYVVADVQGTKAKWGYFHGVHSTKPGKVGKGSILPVYRNILEQRADAFDGVLVATEDQRADLVTRYPHMDVRVAPDTAITKTHMHKEAKHPTVMFVGRFGPDKRPEQALQMMGELVKQVPDARMEFYGYAPDEDTMKRLNDEVTKLGLTDQVQFADYMGLGELSKEYSHGDVIVQTSIAENFGMNLVEAMSYGIPAVSYNIPYGTKALVRDGENGYVVPDGATKQMADKVAQLLTDHDDWQAKSKAAKETASNYTFTRAMGDWRRALR